MDLLFYFGEFEHMHFRISGLIPPQPAPPPEYSDTDKVTIILLDENKERTETIQQYSADYVNPLTSASQYLQSNSSSFYDVVIGERFMDGASGGATNIIQNGGFKNCANIVNAEIYCTSTGYDTTYVDGLGDDFFRGCTALENVILPSSLRKINNAVFRGCTSLDSIEIPGQVESIGGAAFADASIVAITIPSSVAEINDTAFVRCFNITSMTINKPLNSITGAPWTKDFNTPYPYAYNPETLPITWNG